MEDLASIHRAQRVWRFASAEFDEASRRLRVDGRTVGLEAKPAQLLSLLLRRAGETVSKAELLASAWPGVTVVEASLPTAMRKLRRALGEDRHATRTIETIPGVGYRLTVPVEVRSSRSLLERHLAMADPLPLHAPDVPGRWRLAGGVVAACLAVAAGSLYLYNWWLPPPAAAQVAYTKEDVATALRRLDVERVEELLRAGWNPDAADKEGNVAIGTVLNVCEWNVEHDRERMVLMVRTLFEGGAKLEHRNVWGDTAYSIAKAPRYCGPDHSVTRMLKAQCYNGYKPLGDRCLATYEMTPAMRQQFGLDG
jgi:DNA-binding winged helix-turn-helix (wHTH) protein